MEHKHIIYRKVWMSQVAPHLSWVFAISKSCFWNCPIDQQQKQNRSKQANKKTTNKQNLWETSNIMIELRCCLRNENLLHDNVLYWWRTISNSEKYQDVKRQTKFSSRQKSADTDNFFSKEDWNCIIFLKKFQAFQMTMR